MSKDELQKLYAKLFRHKRRSFLWIMKCWKMSMNFFLFPYGEMQFIRVNEIWNVIHLPCLFHCLHLLILHFCLTIWKLNLIECETQRFQRFNISIKCQTLCGFTEQYIRQHVAYIINKSLENSIWSFEFFNKISNSLLPRNPINIFCLLLSISFNIICNKTQCVKKT